MEHPSEDQKNVFLVQLLGSWLSCTKDIFHKCILDYNAAFQSFEKIWISSKIPLNKGCRCMKLRLFQLWYTMRHFGRLPLQLWRNLIFAIGNICEQSWIYITRVKSPTRLYTRDSAPVLCPSVFKWSTRKMEIKICYNLRSPENSRAQSTLYFVVDHVRT